MADVKDKVSLKTGKARVGQYPNFFTKGKPNDSGVAYYEADLLFSPEAQKTTEFLALRKAEKDAITAEWKGDTPENLRSAFRKASAKKRQADNTSYYPEADFPGYALIHVKSKNMPGIVDRKIDPDTGKLRIITDDIEVYGGCYVSVSVHPFAYQVKGNAGVSFWMNNVQLLDGTSPALGGYKSAPTDDFGPVEGASDDDLDAAFDDLN